MAERLLFLTGHLAHARLERVLADLGQTSFSHEIVDIGVKVAALMTEEIIVRRLKQPVAADRVVLPGRFKGNLERNAEKAAQAFRSSVARTSWPICPPISGGRASPSTCRSTRCASSRRSSMPRS